MESLALWDGNLIMFIERRIERHQLPYFLQVFNRLTDKPIGFLGDVSEDGLMLISQLPMMIGADFELRLKIPGPNGEFQAVDLTATCLWSREDVNPQHYDSGFRVLQACEEYAQLIGALLHYFSFDPLQASV
ncbi:PilZ domain-containing protein [Pseudomonas orientalis]|uniref:PilZ domain-containing protein n=2 Tax=Pseudomonas orientalis TaxID=76758 RepID=A0A8B3XY53_9PSED|nr:PilZ domain-containing protein [Pseudomonas orientalis]